MPLIHPPAWKEEVNKEKTRYRKKSDKKQGHVYSLQFFLVIMIVKHPGMFRSNHSSVACPLPNVRLSDSTDACRALREEVRLGTDVERVEDKGKITCCVMRCLALLTMNAWHGASVFPG